MTSAVGGQKADGRPSDGRTAGGGIRRLSGPAEKSGGFPALIRAR
jgi:hypothetical protein